MADQIVIISTRLVSRRDHGDYRQQRQDVQQIEGEVPAVLAGEQQGEGERGQRQKYHSQFLTNAFSQLINCP